MSSIVVVVVGDCGKGGGWAVVSPAAIWSHARARGKGTFASTVYEVARFPAGAGMLIIFADDQ